MLVNLPYAYPDGQALDPEKHNHNIRPPAGAPPHEGLMSVINGRLDQSNFDARFEIEDHHVLPGAQVRGYTGFAREPIDCFDDAWSVGVNAKTANIANADGNEWRAIPGAAVRFNLPHQFHCVVYHWQFFFDVFRPVWEPHRDYANRVINNEIQTSESPDIGVAFRVNGVLIEASKRPVPGTAHYHPDVYAPDDSEAQESYCVRRGAQWWDMHYMALNEEIHIGFNDFQPVLYMEPATTGRPTIFPAGGVQLNRYRMRSNQGFLVRANHYIYGRITFGIRQVRAVCYRMED